MVESKIPQIDTSQSQEIFKIVQSTFVKEIFGDKVGLRQDLVDEDLQSKQVFVHKEQQTKSLAQWLVLLHQ